jgi:hypothetical protein
VLNKKSAWLLGYFTFFWAFFLDLIESKPFSYWHFRLFQQALFKSKGAKPISIIIYSVFQSAEVQKLWVLGKREEK